MSERKSRIDHFPSTHSHEPNGIEGEDPVYDYSNSRLKNDTVADFRPMEAASDRT
jgi:hypothetical protein